jgi:diadenylate cyclase
VDFLEFKLIDLIDIFLAAILIYQVYRLVKGTVAINIFIGVTVIYLVWKVVEAMHMRLLSEILGQFIGLGVLALIIVFQQEIRKFLLMIGASGVKGRKNIFRQLSGIKARAAENVDVETIVNACRNLSHDKLGALIVITRNSQLGFFEQTGDRLNAVLSSRLLESVFQKNAPMHDGAVIITGNEILAARCVLPVSDNRELPSNLGMRHRSALGITEQTDALAVVVSEENGKLSYAKEGALQYDLEHTELLKQLEADLN